MRVIRALTLALSLVVCSLFAFAPTHAQVAIGISVDIEPPPLPVYDQPPIPAPGYLWVPGYWAWDDDTGYYWVPGTWVLPPEPELLWTPGYWGWNDGVYVFNDGYWGPQIGFYGGVAYGFGYTGVGYEGGYWRNGAFFYNQSVNNISNVSITNVYNKTVVVNNTTNVSYNGGAGGTTAKPTPEQLAAENERHVAPTAEQTRNVQAAAKDPTLSLNNNHGHPTVAATAHPAQFNGPGVVAAHPGKPVAAVTPQGHRVVVPARRRLRPAMRRRLRAAKSVRRRPLPARRSVQALRPPLRARRSAPTSKSIRPPRRWHHACTGPTTQPKQPPTTAAHPPAPQSCRRRHRRPRTQRHLRHLRRARLHRRRLRAWQRRHRRGLPHRRRPPNPSASRVSKTANKHPKDYGAWFPLPLRGTETTNAKGRQKETASDPTLVFAFGSSFR